MAGNPSCGRSVLYSVRQASKRLCCARRFQAGGLAASRCSVPCIRSWLPFCCGLPGSMRRCAIPSRIHHTARRLSPSGPVVAKGEPLSVLIASGNPNKSLYGSEIIYAELKTAAAPAK
jgi:hypothetical protein